jgi:hypothetical protein
VCSNQRPEPFARFNNLVMLENIVVGRKPNPDFTIISALEDVRIFVMSDPPMERY